MKLIFVRSPYFIEIDEAGQVGSKVELFIWYKENTEPVTPTYTLSKSIPSTSITKNVYNISPFVKEHIENTKPPYTQEIENYNDWVYVKVKRYEETSASNYSLIDTVTYIGLNGYSNYVDSYNFNVDEEFYVLNNFDESTKNKFYYNNSYPSITLYIDYTDDTKVYEVKYTNFDSTPVTSTETILDGDAETQYIISIPITKTGLDWENGNKVEILVDEEVIWGKDFVAECENKYTPVRVDYVNKFGVYDFITFFKAKTESYEVKNKEYQLLPDDVNYDTLRGENKFFNYEARQSIKLNTGWVIEDFKVLLKDLMVSETILIDDKPVKLKTMNTDLKTSLQDKMINYQIEFEYSYNQINNVI